MTRERAALARLAIVCAAWALAETLGWWLGSRPVALLVPPAAAVSAFLLTQDLGRRRPRGEVRYWRGRRIDDDDPHGGRWN